MAKSKYRSWVLCCVCEGSDGEPYSWTGFEVASSKEQAKQRYIDRIVNCEGVFKSSEEFAIVHVYEGTIW